MKIKKWIPQKWEYVEVEVDNRCKAYSDDMEEIVVCPNCNKEMKYGEGYTSRVYYTYGEMGYCVCSDCYEKEWKIIE